MTHYPIRIYVLNAGYTAFSLLAEVDDYESAYFTRSFVDVGDFQITINFNKSNAKYFSRGRIIQFGTDTRKVGYITQVAPMVDQGGKGGMALSVQGFELKYLFSKRIVYPQGGSANFYLSGTAEDVLKQAVTAQAGSGAATNRKINLLNVVVSSARGASCKMSARYTNLQDEMRAVSLATFLGYQLALNLSTGKFDFDVIPGIDRRASQSSNGRAIFSTDYETIQSLALTDSEANYWNVAIVGGLGAGTARTITQTYLDASEPADLYRKELFIDARQYANGDLTAKGQGDLGKAQTTMFLDGKALAFSTLLLGRDYDLGDICTVQGFGQSVDTRLTAIRENVAPASYSIDLTWGQPYPTFPLLIDQQYSTTINSLNASETP